MKAVERNVEVGSRKGRVAYSLMDETNVVRPFYLLGMSLRVSLFGTPAGLSCLDT